MRLEAADLSFAYPGRRSRPVLEHVNLRLDQGARLGLRAPSGRGKTTLCQLLAGCRRPTGGQVLLDGKPLWAWRGACPVQMLWQHPETAVDPLLPLGRTLAEAGGAEAGLLDALGIRREWLGRYPAELSGGELQRFCLARALGPATRFLLCDEITAMLDLAAQAGIWALLLDEARRRDLGLLVVSHSGPLLERVCTQVVDLVQLQGRAGSEE